MVIGDRDHRRVVVGEEVGQGLVPVDRRRRQVIAGPVEADLIRQVVGDQEQQGADARGLLLLIADDLPERPACDRARNHLPPTPINRHEALAHLLADDDPTVIAIANHHVLVLRLSRMTDIRAARPWPRSASIRQPRPPKLRGAHA